MCLRMKNEIANVKRPLGVWCTPEARAERLFRPFAPPVLCEHCRGCGRGEPGGRSRRVTPAATRVQLGRTGTEGAGSVQAEPGALSARRGTAARLARPGGTCRCQEVWEGPRRLERTEPWGLGAGEWPARSRRGPGDGGALCCAPSGPRKGGV